MDAFSRARRLGRLCAAAAFLAACAPYAPPRPVAQGPLTLAGAPIRSPGADQNPTYTIEQLKVLPGGKYRVIVSGVQDNACTRAVVENLKAVKGVESAAFDFEEGILWLVVKKGAQVRASKVARAVIHAGREMQLDTPFRIKELRIAE